MTEGYSDFAAVYDSLMAEDADYAGRTAYILKLFKKFDRKPTLLLDVACGTGGFSVPMAKSGIEVIGIDASEEMLLEARNSAANAGVDILFLCQSAENLDLYGTVDGAICCFDSINHITNEKTLLEAFKKISLFLEPERLFIFDVNTPFKHLNILGDNTFVIEKDDIYCVWQNSTDPDSFLTEINLDFFVKNNDKYDRYFESFSEKAYTETELTSMLTDAGFSVEAIFGDMTENAPETDCQRMYFICRKC